MQEEKEMSVCLEFVEAQKKSLNCSVFSLWKGFEEKIASTRVSFQEFVSEVESKEKQLYSVKESVSQSLAELEGKRKSIEEKARDVAEKEEEFKLFYGKGLLKLEQKRKDYMNEVEFREKKLSEQEVNVDGLLGKLEVRRAEIEGLEKSFQERVKEMELKEKAFEGKRKEIESIGRRVDEVDQKEGKMREREKRVASREKEMDLMVERQREVESNAKELELMAEDLALQEKDLQLSRDLNENRSKELDMREKQLDTKEKVLDSKEKLLDTKEEQLDTKEKHLISKEKLLDTKEKQLDAQEKQLDSKEKLLDSKEKQLDAKGKHLDSKEKLLDSKEKQLDAKGKQLDLLKKKNEDQLKKEIIEKHKELDLLKKKNEDQLEKGMIENHKELDLLKKKNEDQLEKDMIEKHKELDLLKKKNEDQLEKDMIEKHKELDLMKKKNEDQLEKEILEKYKEVDLLKKKLEDKIREVELGAREIQSNKELNEKREKELDMREEQLSKVKSTKEVQLEKELLERSKELDLLKKKLVEISNNVSKEKQPHNNGHMNVPSVKEEVLEELTPKQSQNNIHKESLKGKEIHQHKEQSSALRRVSVKEEPHTESVDRNFINSSSAGKRIWEEGRDLQKLLKEHAQDLDSAVDQVLKALQLSKEPAKLVLVAIEGIYATDVRKGKEEYMESSVRSCIFLLEQLPKLSLESLSSLKDQALKLATEWKTKMNTMNSLEVFGFLYLLASFNLAFAFSKDLLMSFLEIVAQYPQTPELCGRLGLKDKIPDLVTELIRKNQLLRAFDYVYEFGLVDKFPLEEILKKHYNYSIMESKKKLRWTNMTPEEAEDKALLVEICALKDVIKCITHHGLHSEYPPDDLITRVELLERQRETLRTSTRPPYLNEKQKIESHPSARVQQDNIRRPFRPSARFRQDKRRHSDDDDVPYTRRSFSPPLRKCPRWVPPEALRSGQSSSQQLGNGPTGFLPDPYKPPLALSRYPYPRDSPSDVNHLIRKYLTKGEEEPMHSGHNPFQYEVDSSYLQPSIPAQGRPFIPFGNWHNYDNPDFGLIH